MSVARCRRGRLTRWPAAAWLSLLLVACAGWDPPLDTSCRAGGVVLDAHFDGGRLGDCTVSGEGGFVLTQYPEDAPPINPSPWYAFRVSGRAGDTARITLRFTEGWARYWPRVSLDGEHWQALDEASVVRAADGRSMTISFTLPAAFAWLAGGELLTDGWYAPWLLELDARDDVEVETIGVTRQGRPLHLAATPPRDEVVLLMGRQHPPEVTGALVMRTFVRTVLGDAPLARAFRDRYQVLIVPMVNPDGVALGHWRHNAGGTDLNRDWGPFTQAETRAIRDHLQATLGDDRRLRLMLDFHSTGRNVFYTQPDAVATDPPGFTARWLDAGRARMPGYGFEREASADTVQANSKNWFHQAFGVPAITYETGDGTDRAELDAAAVVFAEEMMRTLLDAPR